MRSSLDACLWMLALLAAVEACRERPPRDASAPARAAARSAAPAPTVESSSAPAPTVAPPSAAATPGASGPTPASGQALKTALHDVHLALITFYSENTRFPSDRSELESDPRLADAVARLEKAATGLQYSSDGASFSLTVTRTEGSAITLSGNNRRVPRAQPSAASRPAGT